MLKHFQVELFVGITALLAGCGTNSADPADETAKNVYVCTESDEVFVSASTDYRTRHPSTGKQTLVRAMYCPRDRKWYAAPPPDRLQRGTQPPLCPDRKTPMELTGPVPEQATMIDQ